MLPGFSGREEVVVLGGGHRHAGEAFLERIRPARQDKARHGTAVLRDLDVLAGGNFVD